jgi:preprotein translocase subunit SecF
LERLLTNLLILHVKNNQYFINYDWSAINHVYFGGESIRGFIFAMLVGIVVGTYSSLFIATPVLVDTISAADKELIEKQHKEG